MSTYRVPEPIGLQFTKGEFVEVCDRDLSVMSIKKVIYAGKSVVRIADNRRFRASDGWWIGRNGIWPFPSIRHQK
jgi:hypothetical protein